MVAMATASTQQHPEEFKSSVYQRPRADGVLTFVSSCREETHHSECVSNLLLFVHPADAEQH